jgi:2-polyprenyl-3-methyl-5-hydroxy-6-metoxy-1,4-benzoquinol methylase
MGYDYDNNPQGISASNNVFDFNLLKIKLIVDEQLKTKKIKILEIGCGGGRNISALKYKYGDKISCFGVDISETSINYAKKIMKDEFFIVGKTIDDYFQDEKFDIILLVDILEHLDNFFDVEKTLERVSSKLKDSGDVFISCPIESNPLCILWFFDKLKIYKNITLDCFGHTNKFNKIEILEIVKKHLNISKVEYNFHFFTQLGYLVFYYFPKGIIKMVFSKKTQTFFRESNIEISNNFFNKYVLKIYHIIKSPINLLGFIESIIRRKSGFGAQNINIICKKRLS